MRLPPLPNDRPSRWKAWLALAARPRRTGLVLVLAAWTLGAVYLGGATAASWWGKGVVRRVVQANLKLPGRWLAGRLADPPRVYLDLKHKDYQKLAWMRERAIKRGLLLETDQEFVPATLRLNGESYTTQVRLKGDWLDHLSGDRWSFRVRVKGHAAIDGMEQFSLQAPETRNDLGEWLFHRALEREDVLALRYRFVDMFVNGKPLGIYALEEHFGKQLVEHQRRREGPVFRYDETLLWTAKGLADVDAWLTSAIDPFLSGRILADPAAKQQYEAALNLLDGWRRGAFDTAQVFDLERTARYLAVCDLFGAKHAVRWHNNRFYFNPVTARLEPIGFDAKGISPTATLTCDPPGNFITPEIMHRLFDDPRLCAAYTAKLEEIAGPVYVRKLLADLDPELRANLAIFYRDDPSYHLNLEDLEENRALIAGKIHPPSIALAYMDQVRPGPQGPVLTVNVANRVPFRVEVSGGRWAGRELSPASPVVLAPHRSGEVLEYRSVELALPPESAAEAGWREDFRLTCRIAGTSREYSEPVLPWNLSVPPSALADPPWVVAGAAANVADFPFITVDPAARRAVVSPGAWRLDRDLILPEGVTLACGPGTSLDLAQGSLILTRGPVQLLGSPDAPVRIFTSDGTGQGLAVLAPGADCRLEWTRFEGLRWPDRPAWKLTGAVTFYGTGLTAEDCVFDANPAEDSLNLIRCRFELARCTFLRSGSDALDDDFSDGLIRDCRFLDTTNDAMDISGATVQVERVTVQGAGDKGLSAGEGSTITGGGLVVEGARLGVAAKDGSTARLRDVRLVDCRWGFGAYRKKPEFGPGRLEVEHAVVQGVLEGDLIERGSVLVLERRELEGRMAQVAALYYADPGMPQKPGKGARP